MASLSDSDSDSDKLEMSHEEPASQNGPLAKRPRITPNSSGEGISSKPKGNYNAFAEKMMAKMGYKEGTGLGKSSQGRVDIVEASSQRGRRGLGLTIKGLEPSAEVDWDVQEEVILEEKVDWLPSCKEDVPSISTLRTWQTVGPKKRSIDDESNFCTEETLQEVLSSKSIFDHLEPEEMRRARTRSNPYETIRGVFFQNRAAMKMANMDAALDFMFTNPRYPDGKPMLNHNDLLYFADICAGPGGFSEYVLWRKKGETKGFGMTLKGACDFKLEDFFAGPCEMFEPHYGVGGVQGDGDIFRSDNQEAFINFVKSNTDGQGVHFVMADGGFSVEGQENIQEILSKQLYLCQFLVAISILRTGGHFVCKLFDLFTPFSVGLVYLMYRIFDKVSIFKPVTSRPANSERYIICQSMRQDREPVRQYMDEINIELNKLAGVTSKEDVNEIVPLDFLVNNDAFFEYICISNDSLGKQQVLHLKKIRAFTQNTNLYETRQADVRDALLEKWKIPDELRKAPHKQNPKSKFEELIGSENMDYFSHQTEPLSGESIRNINSIFDYRCMVTGDSAGKTAYILGCGRSHVFTWSGKTNTRWTKLEEGLRLELPPDTLIWAEVVTELKGEGSGQRKVTTFHALDALFLCGKDVRNLHFNERIERLRKFVKIITKVTRSDLAHIVVPEVFRLEDLSQIFDRLQIKRVKGGGGGDKLCYCPQVSTDNRFFRPSGVYIVRTIQDPWTMQWSRSNKIKYFFNLKTGVSSFQCPPESIASPRFSKLQSYHWLWEDGVKLLEQQQCREDESKLSKANVMDFLQRLMPHR